MNQPWSWVERGDTFDPSIYKSKRWNYDLGRNSLNLNDYLGQQNETRFWSEKAIEFRECAETRELNSNPRECAETRELNSNPESEQKQES